MRRLRQQSRVNRLGSLFIRITSEDLPSPHVTRHQLIDIAASTLFRPDLLTERSERPSDVPDIRSRCSSTVSDGNIAADPSSSTHISRERGTVLEIRTRGCGTDTRCLFLPEGEPCIVARAAGYHGSAYASRFLHVVSCGVLCSGYEVGGIVNDMIGSCSMLCVGA